MVFTIAIVKGGTGKTTTTVNLAEYIARVRKEKVLIIDMDPQANASTFYLDVDMVEKNNLLTFLLDKQPKKAIHKVSENIDIIPGTLNLFNFDKIFNNIKGLEILVKTKLLKIIDKYDHVIIDTNSSLGTLITNALMMADVVISPVNKASRMGFEGLDLLAGEIEELKSNLLLKDFVNIKDFYIIPTMIGKFSFSERQKIGKIKELFPDMSVLSHVEYSGDISSNQDEKVFKTDKMFKNYTKAFGEIKWQ